MKNSVLKQVATKEDWKKIFKLTHGVADIENMKDYDLNKTLDLFIMQADDSIIDNMSAGFRIAYNN